MDSVKLMDRTDTKFTFTLQNLEEILPLLVKDYKILEVENKRLSRYQTLYYDTPSFALYTAHHNGKLNRYKIRQRTYVESGIRFLEVKFKSNKNRTIKNRIKLNSNSSDLDDVQHNFLSDNIAFDSKSLLPVLWVNYTRLTFVSLKNTERLTIDLDLNFLNETVNSSMNNLVIAEVKREGKKNSAFITEAKKRHIREGSISKYCLGVALCMNKVKKNNFKERILNLKKTLSNDTIAIN